MYLGGAVKQDLEPMLRSLHIDFHKGLDKVLPRNVGKKFYDSLPPAEGAVMLRKLANYTKDFDARNGTKLFDALMKNGFPAP